MGFGPNDGGNGDDDGEHREGSPRLPDPMAEMLGQLMGPGGADELAKAMEAAGVGPVDPSQLTAMIGQVQRMLATPGDGGPASRTASSTARRSATPMLLSPCSTTA